MWQCFGFTYGHPYDYFGAPTVVANMKIASHFFPANQKVLKVIIDFVGKRLLRC